MTKRVAVITTGECERKALGPSLQRIFPDARFATLYVDSFTSADLSKPLRPPSSYTETSVQKLARAVIAATVDSPTPDLVLAVDDLELVNAPHPERVVQHLRDAIIARLGALASERLMAPAPFRHHELVERVRTRCSFHLFTPMVEAYFFRDPAALTRAGASRSALVDLDRDVEDFETFDPEFLAQPDSRDIRWAKPHRARHPKLYLQFLCDPTGQSPRTRAYVETRDGCAALAALDWRTVHARREHVRFARSMFEDLALGLGVDNPFPGTSHPLTAPFRSATVLRNL